jgi:hypothetical protein
MKKAYEMNKCFTVMHLITAANFAEDIRHEAPLGSDNRDSTLQTLSYENSSKLSDSAPQFLRCPCPQALLIRERVKFDPILRKPVLQFSS